MTPFDIVYSLNITVIIVMSVFIYYYLLWIFCHSALCVDQPLPLVVYASYRVYLIVMLRQAARMSSWAVTTGCPSLGRWLSYRSVVYLGADLPLPVRLYPPPTLLRVDRWPSVRVELVFDPVLRCARSHFEPVAARAGDSGSHRWVMHVRPFPARSTGPVRALPRARAV